MRVIVLDAQERVVFDKPADPGTLDEPAAVQFLDELSDALDGARPRPPALRLLKCA